MIFTKYNSIFHLISMGFFMIILFFTANEKFRSYLYSAIICAVATILLLLINLFATGSMMGERLLPVIVDENIRMSISNFLYNLNPFFYGETNLIGSLKITWNLAYVPAVAILALLAYLIIKKLRSESNANHVILFCLISSVVFSALTIYSYFNIKLDVLNYRLLLGYYLPLFLAVAFSVNIQSRMKNYTYLSILLIIFTLDLLSKIRFIMTS